MLLESVEVNRLESRVHLLRKLLSAYYTPFTVEFYLKQLDEVSLETFEDSLVFDDEGRLHLIDPMRGNVHNHEKYDYKAYFRSLVSDENNRLNDNLMDYYISDYFYNYQQGRNINNVSELEDWNYYLGRISLVNHVLRQSYNDYQILTLAGMYGFINYEGKLSVHLPSNGSLHDSIDRIEADISDVKNPYDFKGALFENSVIDLEKIGEFDNFQKYLEWFADEDLGMSLKTEADLIKVMNEITFGWYGLVTESNVNEIIAAFKEEEITSGPLAESKDGTIFYYWEDIKSVCVFDYKECIFSLTDLDRDTATDEEIEEQVHLYAYKQRELLNELSKVEL